VLRGGAAAPAFRLLAETKLLDELLPEVAEHLRRAGRRGEQDPPHLRQLAALDDAVTAVDGSDASNALLLAVLTVALVEEELGKRAGRPMACWQASQEELEDAIEAAGRPILRRFTVSRRDTEGLREILHLQRRLVEAASQPLRREKVAVFGRRPRFHEAVAFLALLATVDDELRVAEQAWRAAAATVEPVEEERPPRRRRAPRRQERW
jgi:hypothetical protein